MANSIDDLSSCSRSSTRSPASRRGSRRPRIPWTRCSPRRRTRLPVCIDSRRRLAHHHHHCRHRRVNHLSASPPSWVDPFDLNLAPPVGSRSPATATERPSGHHVATSNRDVGGGILGSPPPRPVTGMSHNPSSRPPDSFPDMRQTPVRTSPLPN
ncbi:hypothetical protein PAHAL_2G494900 [Panicum hallii]|uniref:Uncharacterized protein n=1 Tax=Panicum hallii TaxID=206008 RepID=A0A2T8KTE2_9POAL|nr:hypothetical protein PAHAL_2G494900 [Panicum hallii]